MILFVLRKRNLATMQFSIALLLLVMLAVGSVLSTTIINGVDSLPLLLPHVICIAFVVYLRRRGNNKMAMSFVGVYVAIWLLTAYVSPYCIKARYAGPEHRTDISWKYEPNMYPPIVSRGKSIQFNPPWYYCHVKSTPCPLITVADHGMLGENNSGTGGRSWFLWIGFTSIPIWRSSSWTQL